MNKVLSIYMQDNGLFTIVFTLLGIEMNNLTTKDVQRKIGLLGERIDV